MTLKRVCEHDYSREDLRKPQIKVIKYLFIGLQKTDKGV